MQMPRAQWQWQWSHICPRQITWLVYVHLTIN
jgi:hypothetical protein